MKRLIRKQKCKQKGKHPKKRFAIQAELHVVSGEAYLQVLEHAVQASPPCSVILVFYAPNTVCKMPISTNVSRKQYVTCSKICFHIFAVLEVYRFS